MLRRERLDDPALEARAREISRELRCQSARTSRSTIRTRRSPPICASWRARVEGGDTDQQVFAYLTQRYGDYVPLRPPVRGVTLLLWFGPAVFLLVAAVAIVLYVRRRRTVPEAAPLAPEEERRPNALLHSGRGPP